MKKRQILAILLTVMLLIALLTGCGSSSNGTSANDAYAPQEKGEGIYESADSAESPMPDNQKLIKTIYITAETEDLDALLAQLDAQISALGGYTEQRSVYNGSAHSNYRYRNADLTIRIPAEKADTFVNTVEGASNVVSSNQTVDDVTLSYVATESRMKALQVEQERLLALLEQAETMSDLLEIEARLTEVRSDLENITSQLLVMDNLVDYATIHLEISQVVEYTEPEPETFWERISKGFVRSLENLWDGLVEFVIFLIVASPYLVLYGAILTVVCILVRRFRKKAKMRKAQNPEEPTE